MNFIYINFIITRNINILKLKLKIKNNKYIINALKKNFLSYFFFYLLILFISRIENIFIKNL